MKRLYTSIDIKEIAISAGAWFLVGLTVAAVFRWAGWI